VYEIYEFVTLICANGMEYASQVDVTYFCSVALTSMNSHVQHVYTSSSKC